MATSNPNSPKIPGTATGRRAQSSTPYGCNKVQSDTFNPHHLTDTVGLIQEVPHSHRQELAEQIDDVAPVDDPIGRGHSSKWRRLTPPQGVTKVDGVQPAKYDRIH